ncbi:MAG TPA: S24 family peptidase [Usitatibacteraceae bacterium]|nr:S24 family peptidase [Usitatibacteraceae bacterium]
MSEKRRFIPIATAPVSPEGPDEGACSGAESFALRVLGDSMAPEFEEGDIIVIEPDGLATDGAFVLAHASGEWIFRQLAAVGTGWELRALAPGHAPIALAELSAVKGVIIQKSKPGRRRAAKRYGPT